MKNSTGIKVRGLDYMRHGVSGFAEGRNGYSFSFSVSHGLVEVESREDMNYEEKADHRQIVRELKKMFSDVIDGAYQWVRESTGTERP